MWEFDRYIIEFFIGQIIIIFKNASSINKANAPLGRFLVGHP